MTSSPQTVEGGARGWWSSRFHIQDIVLLAAIGGAILAAWISASPDFKIAAWVIGTAAGIYILLTRLLLRNPYSARLLPLRIAISLALASVVFYLLHNLMHEFLLVFLLPILFYATRFGTHAGLATAAASSLALFVVCLLRQGFAMEAELSVMVLATVFFFFSGTMAGVITSELRRRNQEIAARAEELERANVALAEEKREIEQLHEELQQRGQELELLATTDGLTGLANRRHFNEILGMEFEGAKRYERKLALIMLDVDGLKRVNDAYGHQSGDALLIGVAELLRRGLRLADLAARWGGDEFVALLPETDGESATQVAERIRASITGHVFEHDGRSVQTTVSIGIACYPSPGIASEDDLLRLADEALYEARRRRREERGC